MRYKLTAAVFFHVVALACLAAGCARAPQPTASVGTAATPSPAASASAEAPRERANPCPEGVQSPLPPPTGYVNDYARALDETARRQLEERLTRLKERAQIELAVVTVETTGGQDVARYSLDVARCWGVGPVGEEGGGLLLLVAVKDRKWHIQVSRGLERDLPDPEVADIGSRMRPHFVKGDYGPGIEAGVDGLVKRLAEKRNFQP